MSGDLVRLQGYPSSHLISYSVHDPGWFSGSCGQFSDWFTSGCAAWFLGVIIAVLITLTHQHMSTATAIINGNTVEADLSTLATLLNMVSDNMIPTVPVIEEDEEVEYIHWDSLIKTESAIILKEFYPNDADERALSILEGLKISRRNEDYRSFIPTYWQFNARNNLKIRQLLKLVSAADRIIHFTNTRAYNKQQLSSLRSEIKFARMCPECGSVANNLWDCIMKDPNVTI